MAKKMLETADEILGQVEEIRGWKFKRPVAKDVRTEAQLREYIEGKLAEELGDGKLERTEAWLRLLALMPADAGYQDIVMEVLINQVVEDFSWSIDRSLLNRQFVSNFVLRISDLKSPKNWLRY